MAVLALIVLALVTGCATKRKALVAPQVTFLEAETGGVSLSLRFLDEEQLKRRFGIDENPFRTQYSRMMLRRIVVFDLTAANAGEGSIELRPTDCELDFGGKTLPASTRVQLVSHWQTMDKNRKTSRGKQLNVEKYVLPNQSKILPGGQLRGYLVFQGNLPNSGTAVVSVPIRAGGGTIPFDFTFEF